MKIYYLPLEIVKFPFVKTEYFSHTLKHCFFVPVFSLFGWVLYILKNMFFWFLMKLHAFTHLLIFF